MSLSKKIVVDLGSQILTAFDGNKVVFTFDCASGDKNNPTPTGSYRIFKKNAIYRSRKYDAQMNYAMFFNEGIAIHEAMVVGLVSYLKYTGFDYFGSHGCIRLESQNAKAIFDWAPVHTLVEIRR